MILTIPLMSQDATEAMKPSLYLMYKLTTGELKSLVFPEFYNMDPFYALTKYKKPFFVPTA